MHSEMDKKVEKKFRYKSILPFGILCFEMIVRLQRTKLSIRYAQDRKIFNSLVSALMRLCYKCPYLVNN